MYRPVVVPRPDVEPHPVEAVSSSLDAATRVGLRPVLCTSGWPPLTMTDRWREAVIDLVKEAEHRLEPPVLMAELPALVFEELRRDDGQIFTTSPVLRDVSGRREDASHFLSRARGRALSLTLNRAASVWASDRLLELVVDHREGVRFELPNGLHTNANVSLGELRHRPGGDGLRHLMAGLLTRQLIAKDVDAIVYWAATSHVTFPSFMDEVARMLVSRGKRVPQIRLTGEYGTPLLESRDSRRLGQIAVDGGTIAVTTDIVASARLLKTIIRTLATDAGVHPESLIVAGLVSFTFSPFDAGQKFRFGKDSITRIKVTRVGAEPCQGGERCGCEDNSEIIAVHSEARPRLARLAPENYQASRATVWSTILSGGRVGRKSGEPDHRHLHDRYLEPNPALVGMLMTDILPELNNMEIDAIVSHLPNRTCQAIADRIKTAVEDRHLPVVSARKTGRGWDVSQTALSPRTSVVVIDDGLNTGQSLMALLELLQERQVVTKAVVVWEDKMPQPVRRGLMAALAAGAYRPDKRAIQVYSLHRSQPLDVTFLDSGSCRRHREAQLLRLIRSNGTVDAQARKALEPYESGEVWDGEGAAGRGTRDAIDVDPSVPAGEQLNRLLAHYDSLLAANHRLIDSAVQDFLPVLRHEGLTEHLGFLDDRWLRRVVPWLEAEDLQEAEGVIRTRLPDPAVAIGTARLTHAMSGAAAANALDRLAELEAQDPQALRGWHQDILRALVYCLAGAEHLSSWIRRDEAGLVTGGPIAVQARGILAALRADFDTPAPEAASLVVWDVQRRRLVYDPPAEFVEAAEKRGWVLDVSARALRHGGDQFQPLAADEAIILATALVRGKLFTKQATDLYWAFPNVRGRRRQRFSTFVKRVERWSARGSDLPLQAGIEARPTTADHREENFLSRTSEGAVVVWREDHPVHEFLKTEAVLAAVRDPVRAPTEMDIADQPRHPKRERRHVPTARAGP